MASFRAPTEKQIAYARDLGITYPRSISFEEMIDLIGAAVNNSPPPSEGTKRWAIREGIAFTRYLDHCSLQKRIMHSYRSRGDTSLVKFYLIEVLRDYTGYLWDDPADSKDDLSLLDSIAQQTIQNLPAFHSVLKQEDPWSGRDSSGQPTSGSRNTRAYKTVIPLLKTAGFKRGRRREDEAVSEPASTLYPPKRSKTYTANWGKLSKEPATDNQKAYATSKGLQYPESITQLEIHDLLVRRRERDSEASVNMRRWAMHSGISFTAYTGNAALLWQLGSKCSDPQSRAEFFVWRIVRRLSKGTWEDPAESGIDPRWVQQLASQVVADPKIFKSMSQNFPYVLREQAPRGRTAMAYAIVANAYSAESTIPCVTAVDITDRLSVHSEYNPATNSKLVLLRKVVTIGLIIASLAATVIYLLTRFDFLRTLSL